MIRHAIDSGVNYVDTAYVYHKGKSEELLATALADGYREKVFLTDKLPLWFAKKHEDLEPLLDESLRRLNTDYLDNYLIHSIEDDFLPRIEKLDILRFMKEMKEKGKIRNIGFSFHGSSPAVFKKVIDMLDWDLCQIQLNYIDENFQAGVTGLKYAASKGIPVIVMEPLKGGKLTTKIPPSVQAFWDKTKIQRSPAEWAFKWVANFPEVLTILSGMGNMDMVNDNLRILSEAEANALTTAELDTIRQVASIYNKLIVYGCTQCRYCMPCLQKLDIPQIIALRNDAEMFDNYEETKRQMHSFVVPLPSACIKCNKCEEVCPQHLAISDIMAECAELFE
jgi:predicted aldo/keto reductase-like oxidoreductase